MKRGQDVIFLSLFCKNLNHASCGMLVALAEQLLELEDLGKTLLENVVSHLGGK